MKHETSIALHAYWQSCHGRTGVPANQIRAVELAPFLPSLFLIDLDPSTGLQVRFCGAAIARRYGRDLSDESFLALWAPADAEALSRHASHMRRRARGLVCGIMAESVGGGFTSFEMPLLPLAGSTGNTGAIGAMARIGGHDEMNRIRARIVSQSLRSLRWLPESGPHAAVGEGLPAALRQARRRYRNFTVLTGGR